MRNVLLCGLMMMSHTLPNLAKADPWSNLQLVGEGKLTVLFWDVYQAQLFTENGRYQEQQYPVALKLTYLRNFKKDDLVSETQNQWQKLGLNNLEQQQRWLDELTRLWRDVKKRDAITLYINKDGISYFFLNDEELGVISEPEFSEAFLAIWLSEDTSEPSVRAQLIAENHNDS